jgi:hypothetical protein
MAKPLLYPEWATTDTTLPATGNTNKQRPKESLRNIGWDKGQIPTAEEWNWQFDNISDWIAWFNENNLATKTFTLTGDVAGTVNYTNEGGFSVTTVIQPNSVTLGTDTTGNYVASANVSGNGLSGSSSTEGGTFTVSSNAVSASTPNTLMYRDGNGDVAATNFVGHLSGNADTSSKWSSARNLAFTGFANGNGDIDGSGNISIALSYGSGFTSSKSINGYAYRPDGLIEQWGYTNDNTITLPITYPNACLNASISSNNTATWGYDYKIAVSNLTTSSITITKDSDDAGSYVYWRTIGF